ncbi:MAG: deoxyribose-phosphate aldolase [Firmicutes bacterium]|nr:deoxyribose-phosphate aldolase [Bacillota bacterium]
MIDHTALKPWVGRDEVLKLCGEARERDFATVFINSCWVPLAVRELRGSPVKVGTTIGFPLGACMTSVKVFEAVEAVRAGAGEVDMVMNIGALKDGDSESALNDMRAVVEAARAEAARAGVEVVVKVIIETCYLDDAHKVLASKLVVQAGADFVKTSTGFGSGGATVEDVRLISSVVAGRARVKAAGGIQTLSQAKALIEAGASRLGTSRGVALDDEMGATTA